MKRAFKKLSLFVISTAIFIICIIYGSETRENVIVYSDGFVDNGNIKSMNTNSYYGFTRSDEEGGIESGSFTIPEDGRVQLKVKARTEGKDEFFISFKDAEGNVIFEERSSSIFYSKIIDSKAGEWYFQINGQDVKTGDFKYTVVKK